MHGREAQKIKFPTLEGPAERHDRADFICKAGACMSYVSVVTDFFATRQGADFIFSPADYATIAEWEKQEIPLAFVLSTIDRVIGESEKRKETIGSIIQISGSVQSRFADWLRDCETISSC
jgi:hypothetical protein